MKKIIILLVLVWLSYSCTSKKGGESVDSTSFSVSKSEIEKQIDSLVYDIPSPAEIPFLLQQTGADFMPTLLNDINNVDVYMATNHKSAINMGVFATDIGYLIAYDRTQEALRYINETRKISDKLGLNSTYSTKMLGRFERNLDKKDSLGSIINEAINSSEEFLEKLDRLELSAKIVAGSFIEGLYISTQIIRQYPDILSQEQKDLIMTKLMKVIVDQERPLNELARLLSSFEQDEELEQLYTDLNWLISDFQALNLKEKLSNNEGGVVLQENMLQNITDHLEEIRGRMVE